MRSQTILSRAVLYTIQSKCRYTGEIPDNFKQSCTVYNTVKIGDILARPQTILSRAVLYIIQSKRRYTGEIPDNFKQSCTVYNTVKKAIYW